MLKKLTIQQVTSFNATATARLISTCGENWKKEFLKAKQNHRDRKTKKIEFKLPVLAHIILDDLHDENGEIIMQERKLANMLMKKVHDHNPEHIHSLLNSFLPVDTIVTYWVSARADLNSKNVIKGFDDMLLKSVKANIECASTQKKLEVMLSA